MNSQLSQDESDLENINVKTRPMTIMEDYNLFCSQEWLEAKTDVDKWAKKEGLEMDECVRCTILTQTVKVIMENFLKLKWTLHYFKFISNFLITVIFLYSILR